MSVPESVLDEIEDIKQRLDDLENLHRSLEAMVYSVLRKQDTINKEILKKLKDHE